MAALDTLDIFEPGGKNFSLCAGGQDLSKGISAVDSVRIVCKRVKTEDGVTSSRSGESDHRAGTDRAWILKDAGRATVVEASLIDGGDGKAFFLGRVDDLAFSRKKIEHVIGNERPTNYRAPLHKCERVFSPTLILHQDSLASGNARHPIYQTGWIVRRAKQHRLIISGR